MILACRKASEMQLTLLDDGESTADTQAAVDSPQYQQRALETTRNAADRPV